MKNKESFLKELQSRLSVLEEAEQQDILSEYAQHIDLRVNGGLTEEEAIRDFGDMEQLTAEILSAYHVKPTYQAPGEKQKLPSPWPTLRRGGARAAAFFRRLGEKCSPRKLWKAVAAWWERVQGRLRLNQDFFEEPEAVDTSAAEENAAPAELAAEGLPCSEEMENKEEPVKEKKETAWTAVGGFFRRLGHGLWRLVRAAAWLAWNLLLLLCALPFVCLGLAALICLGLLAVLLVQGYPLAGVTLCCLGGAACCVGILGLGSGLVWHRAKPAVQIAGAGEPVAAPDWEPAEEAERREVTADDGE